MSSITADDGGNLYLAAGKVIDVWDIRKMESYKHLDVGINREFSVTWTPSNKLVTVAYGTTTTSVRTLEGEEIWSIPECSALSPDGYNLVSFYTNDSKVEPWKGWRHYRCTARKTKQVKSAASVIA